MSEVKRQADLTPEAEVATKPPDTLPATARSRRRFLRNLGIFATGLALPALGFGLTSSESPIKPDERVRTLGILLQKLGETKNSNNPEAFRDQQKVLYLWLVCNAMETGARAIGHDLSAEGMHNFLYGDGKVWDISQKLSTVLNRVPESLSDNTKGVRFLLPNLDDINSDILPIRTPWRNIKPQQVANLFFEASQISHDKPFSKHVNPTYANNSSSVDIDSIEKDSSFKDWFNALGNSDYFTTFGFTPGKFEVIDGLTPNKPDAKWLVLELSEFDTELVDRYAWGRDLPLSPAHRFVKPFLTSLPGIDRLGNMDLITPLLSQIDRWDASLFPGGSKEKDLNLLIKAGLAQEFDVKGYSSGRDLHFPVAFNISSPPQQTSQRVV